MTLKVKSIKLTNAVAMSARTGNVYEYTDANNSRTKPGVHRVGGTEVVKWGTDNLLPFQYRQILADNDIKQGIINTTADINSGKGLVPYTLSPTNDEGKREVQFITDPELEDWRDSLELNELFMMTQQDYSEFGQSWVEFILTRDRSRVASIESLNAVDCRVGKVRDGQIYSDTVYIADWKYQQLKEKDITPVPMLAHKNPTLGQQTKVVMQARFRYSGQPYYSLPEWHGTRTWAKVSNKIPDFHLSGLDNGYLLRYHVKIPMSYIMNFADIAKKENGSLTESQAIQKVKQDIQDELDKVLKGTDNAHRSFMSFLNDAVPGGDTTGWSLDKIETDLKDDSYIKLSDTADKKHARGHSLHPVLAGIETSGSLSSGSEILNLLNYHIAYKTTRPRQIGMKPIHLAFRHDFPDRWAAGERWTVEDVELTTLDANPSGKQSTISE